MEKYEEVLHNLDFARELHKTLDGLTQNVNVSGHVVFISWLGVIMPWVLGCLCCVWSALDKSIQNYTW